MKQQTKKQIFIEYTILFVILCLIVFYPFYHQGLSLVWGNNGNDGLSQHLNAVTYWGQYLHDLLNNLIHGQFKLPMWDNSIGYGADILATLNYYAIGDPINFIYIFSNKYNAEYFYDFAMILRLYLAGGAFVYFGYYLKKDHVGTLFGSMAYIFCGYVMLGAVRHPFFLNPMIYLPLLIIGVEKIYKKQNPYIFTIVVAIAAMSNFYFFYMLMAVTVIYAFIRFPVYREDGFFKTLARFAGWYMLGIGISAIILLPVLIGFMGNARGSSGINYFMMWYYPKKYYKGLILQSIGYKNVARGTTLNYIALSYCAVIALFLKRNKKRAAYKAAAIISAVCLVSPICSYALHGFSYPVSRWIFAVSFVVGAVIMEVYPDLLALTWIQKIGILAGTVFYYAFYRWKASNIKVTKIAAIMLIITVVTLFIVNEIKFISKCKLKHVIVGIIVTVSVGASSFSHFSPKVTSFSGEYLKSGEAYKTLCSKEISILKTRKKQINQLYRTDDADVSLLNWGLIDHIPTTTNYLSITDGNVSDTLRGLGLTRYKYKFSFRRLDRRGILEDLFGVKYLLGRTGDSSKIPTNYKLLDSKNGVNLYENKNVFPFGYTYDTYMTRSQYDKLKPAQKEEAMLHSAIVEDDSNSVSYLNKSDYQSAITIKTIGKDYFIRKKKNGIQTVQVKIPKGYVTDTSYLYLEGVRCKAIDQNSKKHELGEGFNSNGFHVDFGGHNWYFEITEKNSTYDMGEREYLARVLNNKSDTATFTFERNDDYSIKKLSIIQINKQKQNQAILERKNSEHLENISYDGSNHFSGEIKTSGSKMLCIPIPYSKGWKATDNGKSVKIEKVNGMFLGIHLDEGIHNIKLDYTTPGIKAGAVITVASMIIVIVLWRKRKQNN